MPVTLVHCSFVKFKCRKRGFFSFNSAAVSCDMPVSKRSVLSLVSAPPVFIKTPPTFVEVLLGDSLTLSCGAHGNPRPTVVWHKDDSRIEKHEKIKVSWTDGTSSVSLKFTFLSYSFQESYPLSSSKVS